MKVPNTERGDAATTRSINWGSGIFLVVAHIAAVVAAVFFWSWPAMICAVILYWVAGSLGIGMGYHRLMTHRGYFAFANMRMHHRLAGPIGPGAIVRCSDLCRSSTSGPGLMRNTRVAERTADPANPSGLHNRNDDMAALFATGNAHMFNSISDCESSFLFHNAPS